MVSVLSFILFYLHQGHVIKKSKMLFDPYMIVQHPAKEIVKICRLLNELRPNSCACFVFQNLVAADKNRTFFLHVSGSCRCIIDMSGSVDHYRCLINKFQKAENGIQAFYGKISSAMMLWWRW